MGLRIGKNLDTTEGIITRKKESKECQLVIMICSIVLTGNGEVFTFGCGTEGRLGHGDEHSRFGPTRVEALNGIRVSSSRS